MNYFKYIVVVAFFVGTIGNAFAEDTVSKYSVKMRNSIFYGQVGIEDNSNFNFNPVYVPFQSKSYGIELGYIFTPYTVLNSTLYVIPNCDINSNEFSLTCNMEEPIWGQSIDVLVGTNFRNDGVYVYSGLRYYFESNSTTSLSSLTLPVGVGVRYRSVSIEVGGELRGLEADFYLYGFIDLASEDYRLESTEETASVAPLHFSIGYVF